MPIFDPDFSTNSYGFRPGKSAHQAVKKAKEYIADGYRWVVDMDLAQFFDRVNHWAESKHRDGGPTGHPQPIPERLDGLLSTH
ncbi:conserved hypothetical protein [Heliomicrobium modesticaldum Ice1]|uniref:Uncharacterized protein n=2 Tax=Heliomicrobium modesticaldum TaxID=35701 RepID=B0TDJ3_HELMI|nr:reverse transcriptase domain-containing protein [Heliomicrobium modesticaldum]ABZ85518.1 conserved hypothetical protein [Heliomicrobium modesticaldum Ice1]